MKNFFKLVRQAERYELLAVNTYLLNMSDTPTELIKALRLQQALTTNRYKTFIEVLRNSEPEVVKFLFKAYSYSYDTIKKYLKDGLKND